MSYTSPTYKTERLSYKNGHAMWVMKCLIETGLQCYSKNFGLRLLLKSVITKVLLYKVKFKSVWVAMCSLVMSLSSRDFLIKYYLPWQLIYSSGTYVVPGF